MATKPVREKVNGRGEGRADGRDRVAEQRAILGQRIRACRQSQGLSLEELAGRAGLTAGFLSQIERGLSSPSIDSLRRISSALGVPIFFFLSETSPRPPVVRRDQRRVLRLPGKEVTYELLTPDLNRKMELFIGELRAGVKNVVHRLSVPTEECIFVLEGRLRVTLVEGEYVLEAGDSIYFDGPALQDLECAEGERAVFLSAITPPVF